MQEVLGSWLVNPKPVGRYGSGELVYAVRCINCENDKKVRRAVLNKWRASPAQAHCPRCRQYSKGFRRISMEAQAHKLARQILVVMIDQIGVVNDESPSHIVHGKRNESGTMASATRAGQLPVAQTGVGSRETA